MEGDYIEPDQLNSLKHHVENEFHKKQHIQYQDLKKENDGNLLHEFQMHQIDGGLQREGFLYAYVQIENALNKYYERYDSAPMGYFTVNESGEILEVNTTGAELMNVNKQQLINNYFQNFVDTDYLHIYNTFTKNILETGLKQNCEIKIIKNGMTSLYVAMQGSCAKNGEEARPHMLFSVFDITDRIIAEQLKEEARIFEQEESNRKLKEIMLVDKLKLEFFTNQSHELRTPLNVIYGTLQLLELQKASFPTEIKKVLDKHTYIIRQNCLRLLRLINNIIDITKIEAGFYELHLENGNIISTIEDITQSVADYIESKGLSLVFDTDVEEKIAAYDGDKMERIMLNILSNAIKFTEPGGKILVNIHDEGDNIEISIKDTGIGIPEDKLDMLFQRFYQVDMSLTRKCEGSGIGLSLVKSLVEMHDGSLTVNSIYGEGSEFIIKLPIRQVKEDTVISRTDKNLTHSHVEKLDIEFSDIYIK